MAVQFRIGKTILTIARAGSGDLAVTSDQADNIGRLEAGLATLYIRDNLIFRGWTLCDELRVAQKIVHHFRGKILDFDTLKKSIRRAWSKLLKANLIPDPSQAYGGRKNELVTPWYLSVSVRAGERRIVHTGGPHYRAIYHIGDPDQLVVYRMHKPKPWRAHWERIREITFSYFEPPAAQPRGSRKKWRITPSAP